MRLVQHNPDPQVRPVSRGGDSDRGVVGVLTYLVVLTGVVVGLLIALRGSRYTGIGAGLAGCALLVAAVARVALPPRYAGPLASRSKVVDVLAFTVLGGGVLGLALWLHNAF
ncbi:MAG: DUF3017 domain-containing protein [Streptosporangiaceae bacterium]|nr:DUF3017 domain-containing protein [Streptosporangiaceae bacterium]